jgi:hypothetical protein
MKKAAMERNPLGTPASQSYYVNHYRDIKGDETPKIARI